MVLLATRVLEHGSGQAGVAPSPFQDRGSHKPQTCVDRGISSSSAGHGGVLKKVRITFKRSRAPLTDMLRNPNFSSISARKIRISWGPVQDGELQRSSTCDITANTDSTKLTQVVQPPQTPASRRKGSSSYLKSLGR